MRLWDLRTSTPWMKGTAPNRGLELQPHRHQNVKVTLVSTLADYTRAEFILQLDVDFSFAAEHCQNIEKVAGIEANRDGLAFVLGVNLFHSLSQVWVIGR